MRFIRTKTLAKTFVITSTTLTLCGLLAPFVFGILAEHHIKSQLNFLASPHPVESKIVFYSRGWLRSRFVNRVTLANSNLQLYLSHSVRHGPFLLSRNQIFNPKIAAISTSAPTWQQTLASVYESQVLLKTNIYFLGDRETIVAPYSSEISEIELSRLSLEFGDIYGYNTRSRKDRHKNSRGWIKVRSVEIHDNTLFSTLINADLQFSVQGTPDETSAQAHLKLDELTLTADTAHLKSLANRVNVEAMSDQDFALIKIEGVSGSATIEGESFHNVAYDASLAIPLHDKTQIVSKSTKRLLNNEFNYVLPTGTVFSINRFSFQHRGRDVKLWLSLKTNSPIVCCTHTITSILDQASVDAEVIANENIVYELLEKRTRDIINQTDSFGEMITFSDAEAAPLIANSVASQLDILQSQNYLDYDGQNYAAKIALRDGHLTINGKPLLLSRFMK